MDGGAPRFSPSFPDPPITSHDLEAGCSGGSAAFACYPSAIRRMGSYRALVRPRPPTGSGEAAAGFFCDPLSDEEPHHYLDSCFLCKKHLASDRDIFMYRGDTPFCSEECRQQQIDMDETEGKKWKRISGMRKQGQQHISGGATSPKSQKIRVRAAGTVVAG